MTPNKMPDGCATDKEILENEKRVFYHDEDAKRQAKLIARIDFEETKAAAHLKHVQAADLRIAELRGALDTAIHAAELAMKCVEFHKGQIWRLGGKADTKYEGEIAKDIKKARAALAGKEKP